LERLSAALGELRARIRTATVAEGLALDHDAAYLARANMWNLQCAHGASDITFQPASGGYDHLAVRARLVTVRAVDIPVAGLADVVASKRLADRPKDQLVLPQLDQALFDRDQSRRATPAPPEPET
jgi:hypothetical protein